MADLLDSRSGTGAMRFRFRPGRPLVAVAAGATGAVLVVSSVLGAPVPGRAIAIALGAIAVGLAIFYLVSPAWRTEVLVDDGGLEVVQRGSGRLFRLAWSEVVRVVAAPATASAFVDGGEPRRSLLLPGPSARAPYRIDGQRELYEQICARVAPDRVTEVEKLDRRAVG